MPVICVKYEQRYQRYRDMEKDTRIKRPVICYFMRCFPATPRDLPDKARLKRKKVVGKFAEYHFSETCKIALSVPAGVSSFIETR
ncbi:hypothetical protein CDAR_469671 [Caerostris darwini]|uniref:Uncharacterized protein n=1 Tax=Caerostris darwini TaxID=1538125 RepID=A0AAV4RTC6_9ARAC|nr:hypothetical protein CDAR_469671 [Caerostris darwini]